MPYESAFEDVTGLPCENRGISGSVRTLRGGFVPAGDKTCIAGADSRDHSRCDVDTFTRLSAEALGRSSFFLRDSELGS